MKPTRIRVLVLVTVVVGLVTYFSISAVYADIPTLPRYAPVSLLLLALIDGYAALTTRHRRGPPDPDPRRRAERPPLDPLLTARFVVLAKATAVLGALALGAYAAILGVVVDELDSTGPARDAVTAGLGVGASLLLAAAALLLERACRVAPPGDDDEPD